MRFALGVPRWVELAVMFAACYLCVDGLVWLLRAVAHGEPFLDAELRRILLLVHLGVLCGAALIWTLVRASKCHMTSQAGYRKWLRTTPWHPGMPLPLGPATLVWSDGIVLLILAALAHWHLHVTIALPILGMCCGFAVGCLPVLTQTFGWGAYVIALGLAFELKAVGSAVTFKSLPMLYLGSAIAVGLAAWAQFSVRQSLRGFPWEIDPSKQAPPRPGWLSMIPRDCAPLVSLRTAIATSVFFGAWVWALLSLNEGTIDRGRAFVVIALFAMFGALVRFAKYYGNYRAPMSPLARLLTGRLVIPGYDYAMIAPIGAIVVPAATALGTAWLRAPAALIAASGVAVSIAVLLIAPPTLRNWELTGCHRRIPFSLAARRKQRRLGNK
ncbi:MAG TPA: hypothetical protein VGI81_25655 [Tepidisphaeraceae bacterium]|jgi:hypothetical protein